MKPNMAIYGNSQTQASTSKRSEPTNPTVQWFKNFDVHMIGTLAAPLSEGAILALF